MMIEGAMLCARIHLILTLIGIIHAAFAENWSPERIELEYTIPTIISFQ
jgi:hypothetical protein